LLPTDELPEATDGPQSGGSERLERAQTAATVRAALATLPDSQREVIELHWFQEQPFDEIAEIVGASVSAVKVRAHRGYKVLKKLLEGGPARD
jgi:RNA polymerase sigma-70 factor (ECF subfamily)